jgi:radical SAM protein with 4Fe4S-binding SPASM domain
MDPGLYRKIIDEIVQENKGTVVRPFDGGEPLMRQDIEELIRYAKERGIAYVSINSNGLLLNRDRALSLLASGLDHIEISIDAATAATYRNIRGSEKYDLLVGNVEQLLALRKERTRPIKVTVSFVRQEANQSELLLFRKLWMERVDQVYIREWHQHNRLVDGESVIELAQTPRHPCPYLWDRMIIHHDGQVRFCEADWECSYPVGDVTRESLKDIWNSDVYRCLRESHLLGKFDHSFCRDCSDWPVVTW